MAQANIKAVLDDQVSPKFKQIAGNSKTAFKAVGNQADKADKKIKKIKKSTTSLGSSLKGLVAGFGAMYAGRKVLSFLGDSVKLFQVQEQAVRDADIVFGDYSQSIQDTASDIQKISKIGDEAYINLAVQAANFGIEQEKVNEAVQGAIGITEKYKGAGMTLQMALKGVALGMKQDYTMLQRYIPALRTANTEVEKMSVLQTEMVEGFDFAKESAKSATGQMVRLGNAWGDFKEQVGSLVLKPISGQEDSKIEKTVTLLDKITDVMNLMNRTKASFSLFSSVLWGGDVSQTIKNINQNTEYDKMVREKLTPGQDMFTDFTDTTSYKKDLQKQIDETVGVQVSKRNKLKLELAALGRYINKTTTTTTTNLTAPGGGTVSPTGTKTSTDLGTSATNLSAQRSIRNLTINIDKMTGIENYNTTKGLSENRLQVEKAITEVLRTAVVNGGALTK